MPGGLPNMLGNIEPMQVDAPEEEIGRPTPGSAGDLAFTDLAGHFRAVMGRGGWDTCAMERQAVAKSTCVRAPRIGRLSREVRARERHGRDGGGAGRRQG